MGKPVIEHFGMHMTRRPSLWIAGARALLQRREFVKFTFVGGAGFCVDGGLLTLLMQSGLEILPARSLSFLSAATCTWLLNRFWTFELEKRIGVRKEYASYIVIQIMGAAINLLIFFVLIELHPAWRNIPLIPLAFGAAVSLVFNYTASKKYVFKG